MIYTQEPNNFNSKFEVVSCFLEYDKKILLLHRQNHKPQGGTWGIPAGKINSNEHILDAIIREIKEETGLKLLPTQLSYFKKTYVKLPNLSFIFHIYHYKLDKLPKITINSDEHKDLCWTTPKLALTMDIISDLDQHIKLFYQNLEEN